MVPTVYMVPTFYMVLTIYTVPTVYMVPTVYTIPTVYKVSTIYTYWLSIQYWLLDYYTVCRTSLQYQLSIHYGLSILHQPSTQHWLSIWHRRSIGYQTYMYTVPTVCTLWTICTVKPSVQYGLSIRYWPSIRYPVQREGSNKWPYCSHVPNVIKVRKEIYSKGWAYKPQGGQGQYLPFGHYRPSIRYPVQREGSNKWPYCSHVPTVIEVRAEIYAAGRSCSTPIAPSSTLHDRGGGTEGARGAYLPPPQILLKYQKKGERDNLLLLAPHIFGPSTVIDSACIAT